MTRKRLTQLYPLLLPVRKWQRKKLFYLKMYLSKCNYANVKSPEQIKKLAEKQKKFYM